MSQPESNGPTEFEPQVLFSRHGGLGRITLNRPRAINALTHEMVTAISATLDDWASDDAVRTVVLTGAGERGLCAGGDIVSLYNDAKEGDGAACKAFWWDEYRLNAQIARYPKPYVSIMDGVVLGGGIGLGAHGSHRVVTDSSKLGMPETGIGFVPDVGGTWLLSHAPGELGTHMALTGGIVRAGDAIVAGLADAYVPADRIAALLTTLETTDASEALAAEAQPAPESALQSHRSWIDAAYAGSDVKEVVRRLRAAPGDAAAQAADTIVAKSPIALTVALASLRRAKTLPSLEEALRQEYRVSLRSVRSHDFVEGIRAQVIDKDRQPRWQPTSLAEVTAADVEVFFAPLGSGELVFPGDADGASATPLQREG